MGVGVLVLVEVGAGAAVLGAGFSVAASVADIVGDVTAGVAAAGEESWGRDAVCTAWTRILATDDTP